MLTNCDLSFLTFLGPGIPTWGLEVVAVGDLQPCTGTSHSSHFQLRQPVHPEGKEQRSDGAEVGVDLLNSRSLLNQPVHLESQEIEKHV